MAFRSRWPAWVALALLAACGGAGQAPPQEGAPPPDDAAAMPQASLPADASRLEATTSTRLPGVAENLAEPPDVDALGFSNASPDERIEPIQDLLAENTVTAVRRALRLALDGLDAEPGRDDAPLTPLAAQAAGQLLGWNRLALAHGGGALSSRDLPLLQRWNAEDARVHALAEQLERVERANTMLAQAALLEEAGKVLDSASDSAVTQLREVLRIDPDNVTAQHRLARIENQFLQAAIRAAQAGDFVTAEERLSEAGQVRPASARVLDTATRVVELREQEALRWKAQITIELLADRPDAAEALLPKLEAATLDERDGQVARAEIERVRRYGAYDAGQLLSDALGSGGQGPGMIVIPVGRYLMGSSRSESGHQPAEGPRHAVHFQRGFALARTETTVAQYRAFADASGYRSSAERARRSTIYDERTGAMVERRGVSWRDDYLGNPAADDAPVLHLSWGDADAYAQWLSVETGARYRLPSEAQFEYALRAGSVSRFPWGEGAPTERVDNLTGALDVSSGGRRWSNAFAGYDDGYWGPAPVASHVGNAFGLSDMNGNVSEWVEDCWHDSYARAPRDGSAWVNEGCARRVIRGGSWGSSPEQTRSAFRASAAVEATSARVGFRVVREL